MGVAWKIGRHGEVAFVVCICVSDGMLYVAVQVDCRLLDMRMAWADLVEWGLFWDPFGR